ncbi:hypothetical protein BK809_0001878 [Diplodia seriata]|uniref:GmrSD restriction endonucleases N-terminal domain-containing protein n=1 Tax=Diplodia seriata TaxID=420778 RepID=A0A1S8BBC4_9PEZI|nr:hypothetical protein BK809_0001878 [Diplodia seriata]
MATSLAAAQPNTSNAEARLSARSSDRVNNADFALPRECHTTSVLSGDSLDMSTSSQPRQVKEESETDEDEDNEGDSSRAFQSRQSLPAPRVEHRSLQNLIDLLDNENVDLHPEYQRDVVWNKERMVGLIDSVIDNHYIPPIIFNRQITRNSDGTARVKRVCVDGKQRLSSVKAFIDGKIGCHDRRGSVWYYTQSANRNSRRVVPEHVKASFRDRQLIIYEYPNLQRAQEEDLFSRVQKGVQLTNAEKFRATTGPWQSFAKLYEREFRLVGGLSGTKRGVNFNNILTSFGQIIEVQRGLGDGHTPSFSTQTATIKALLKNLEEYNAGTKEKIRQTYMKFNELIEVDLATFMDNQYSHARLFSPLEFMATTVLISLHLNNEGNLFLLESIRVMRLYLRQCLKDLRMNKSSWDCVWPFIESLLPQHEHEARPSTTLSQTSTPRGTPNDTLVAIRTTLTQKLAHLSPAIEPALILMGGDTNPEPPSTTPTSAPSAVSAHSVQTLYSDRRFTLYHRPEVASSASSPPAGSQPESVEAQPREHTATSMADQLEQMHRPEPHGIGRKRKLARFTTSGSGFKGREGAQPPAVGYASTTQEPASSISTIQGSVDKTTIPSDRKPLTACSPRAKPQQSKPAASVSAIEISDDENGETAENLLATFKPHISKRVKVKEEEVLDV